MAPMVKLTISSDKPPSPSLHLDILKSKYPNQNIKNQNIKMLKSKYQKSKYPNFKIKISSDSRPSLLHLKFLDPNIKQSSFE